MIGFRVIKMAQVDFKKNGLYGGNHGSSKTRREFMAVKRDDGLSLLYTTR